MNVGRIASKVAKILWHSVAPPLRIKNGRVSFKGSLDSRFFKVPNSLEAAQSVPIYQPCSTDHPNSLEAANGPLPIVLCGHLHHTVKNVCVFRQ